MERRAGLGGSAHSESCNNLNFRGVFTSKFSHFVHKRDREREHTGSKLRTVKMHNMGPHCRRRQRRAGTRRHHRTASEQR